MYEHSSPLRNAAVSIGQPSVITGTTASCMVGPTRVRGPKTCRELGSCERGRDVVDRPSRVMHALRTSLNIEDRGCLLQSCRRPQSFDRWRMTNYQIKLTPFSFVIDRYNRHTQQLQTCSSSICNTTLYRRSVGRCGVVGSTLAFGSIGHMGSNPSTAYFHIIVHQPSAS